MLFYEIENELNKKNDTNLEDFSFQLKNCTLATCKERWMLDK